MIEDDEAPGRVRTVADKLSAVSPLALKRRIAVLEEEVQECRQTSLRVAELTDLVTELLVPLVRGDNAEALEILDRYHQSL
ncbi:DUF6752 domain-containing protein [Nocardioides sp.]|uniref:DUF6752 domain-containing protein n=1 Tax=Nocardioides sp. TaxID=35761 RepID=UPI002B26E45B|nr:DUF6752 domain-containing protein [Nocardioides sp.]